MDLQDVKVGLKVKITKLRSTSGMMIHPKRLAVRKAGAKGTVLGYVPGHGGDVWWIEHVDGQVGAYCYDEFKPI